MEEDEQTKTSYNENIQAEVSYSDNRRYENYKLIDFICDRQYNFVEGNIFRYLACYQLVYNNVDNLEKAEYYCNIWRLNHNEKSLLSDKIKVTDFITANQIIPDVGDLLYLFDWTVEYPEKDPHMEHLLTNIDMLIRRLQYFNALTHDGLVAEYRINDNDLSVERSYMENQRYRYYTLPNFITDRNYSFIEGKIFMYLANYKDRGGISDLDKARYYCQLWKQHFDDPREPINEDNVSFIAFINKNGFHPESTNLLQLFDLIVRCHSNRNEIDDLTDLIDQVSRRILQTGEL